MTDPEISVITPSYQQAEFLEDNIQSVKSQCGPSIEHVVVDGGSTDGSVELLQEYENDYRLRWISEPDDGQSDAINKGIKMADGEWFIWVNSDDYLLEGATERFYRARKENPRSDVIYGDQLIVDVDGNTVGRKYNTRPSKFTHKYYYQFAGNHSTYFHRNVFDTVGTLNTDYDFAMDTEFFWRLLQSDLELTSVSEFFATRRLHEKAKTTGTPSPEQIAEINRLESQYPTSQIEQFLPRQLLTVAAAGLQALYHLLDHRPQAIKYMLSRPSAV